jgi:hypothetical protein
MNPRAGLGVLEKLLVAQSQLIGGLLGQQEGLFGLFGMALSQFQGPIEGSKAGPQTLVQRVCLFVPTALDAELHQSEALTSVLAQFLDLVKEIRLGLAEQLAQPDQSRGLVVARSIGLRALSLGKAIHLPGDAGFRNRLRPAF